MILLGIALILIGWILGIGILAAVGAVLAIIGAIAWFGAGRRYY